MGDTEPVEVVISGIGGCFPESNNIEELKKNLFNGVDMITVDKRRWDPDQYKHPKGTGKCSGNMPFEFDFTFFGVNVKAASMMDPINRTSLERAYEAIIDSGNNPSNLSGHNIGVFSNCNISEINADHFFDSSVTGYIIMGANRSMIANRVSFFFNFIGPSCCYDNSWIGDMEVLKMATLQIQQGLIESALVISGVVHSNPSTAGEIAGLSTPQSPELSIDGKCRSFDDQGCGFSRSEAIVALFLERKSIAKRNYGTILHIGTYLYGNRSCSFIEIEQKMVVEALKQFYMECQIDPSLVSYVEADGSSVKRLEAVELNSLAEVFCPNRTSPLLIGSVKSNLGHTESASSLVALVKAIIVAESGMIPANLHYQTPNSAVPALAAGHMKVVTKHEPLKGDLLAVNSISYCGSMGHLLLKRNEKIKNVNSTLPLVLLASARHEEGIDKVNTLIKSMPLDADFCALANNVFKYNITGHGYRSYTLISNEKEIIKQEKREFIYQKQPVWFIFSGMGSQWNGMGVGLMKFPVFAASIDKCQKILEPLGLDLKNILTTTDPNVFQNILNSFVGIAAVQIGLVDLLYSLGVVPDGMIGHSVGELGCAYADGCFTAEEMILSAYARGRASLDTPLIKGLMAAVGIGYHDIKDKLPKSIEVACHNSSTSCTLSGPEEDMTQFTKQLKSQQIFVATVNVGNIAYHSRHIAPAAPALLKGLKKIIKKPKRRSSKWISSSVPEAKWGNEEAQYSSPEYHTNNLLGSVLFEEACKHIPEDAIAIEIAPHGLLQAILRRALTVVNIPLTNKTSESNELFFLQAVGEMYLRNLLPDVNAIYLSDAFPVARGTNCLAQLVTWKHSMFPSVNDTSHPVRTLDIVDLSNYYITNPFLYEYKINKQFMMPTSQLLINIWTNLCDFKGSVQYNIVVFKDLHFYKQLVILELDKTTLGWTLNKGTGIFEVFTSFAEEDNIDLIMSGSISLDLEKTKSFDCDNSDSVIKSSIKITQNEFYNFFKSKGYQFSNHYKVVQDIEIHEKEYIGQIEWIDWMSFLDGLLKVNEYFAAMDTISKDLLMTSYIRMIRININDIYKNGTFQFVKKLSYNYLKCGGVEIHGAEFRELNVTDTHPQVTVEKWEFTPLVNYFNQMDKFVETVLRLIKGNNLKSWVYDKTDYIIYKFKENNVTDHLSEQLKKAVEYLSNSKIQSKSVSIEDLKSSTTPHMIITSAENLPLCVANSDADFFMCHSTHNILLQNNDFHSLIQFKSDELIVTLYKKIKSLKTNVIEQYGESDWLLKLREKVATTDISNKIVVTWTNCLHFEIVRICKTLTKEFYYDRLSCFFILDEKAPTFTVNNPVYSRQLSLGFAVNIYNECSWGYLKRMELAPDQQLVPRHNHFNISMKDFDLQYISINFNQSKVEQSKHLLEAKYIEYSGTTIEGNNVMGIAIYDQKTMKIETDNIMHWTVPKTWNLQDAVTVPIAYITAYFALSFYAIVKKNETVLVTAGYSIMGKAAIAVAQELGGNVFTTVDNNNQALALMKNFPNLNPKQILHYNSNIDYILMDATKGKGIKVILNTMSEGIYKKLIPCMSIFARFIQLSQTEMETKDKLELQYFLRSISFYSIGVDILFNMKDSWKLKLQAHLESGIKKNIVKPLPKNVLMANETSLITKHLKNGLFEEKLVLAMGKQLDSTVSIRKNSFNTLNKKSYLIVGNNDELSLDLIEWLVNNGASNIVLSGSNISLNGHIYYRLLQLIKLCGITIINSSEELNTPLQAHKLIENINKLDPLGAIFNIFMDERASGDVVLNLYSASKDFNSCCFVNIYSEGVKRMPGITIQYQSEPKEVLKYMQQLLGLQQASPTILISDKDLGNSLDMLSQYLPTFEDLKNISTTLESTYIEEECTKAPRARHLRKYNRTWSVFIFPGVSYRTIKPLVMKLAYISYLVNLPTVSQSIEKTASNILEEIVKICDVEAYTFVSETWSGVIATEVGRLLESRGKRVTLILLNAHPSVSQNWAHTFGQPKSAEFEMNLLSSLLKLGTKTKVEVMKAKTWEEKLQCAVSSDDNKDKLVISVTAFYNMLTILLDYKPSEPFQGNVFWLCTSNDNVDVDGELMFNQKNCRKFKINDAVTHTDLINSKTTANIINEQTNFAWF